MRTVEANLMCDGKLNETVSHYIPAHHTSQDVSVDTSGLHLASNDDSHRIVTVMHQNHFSSQTLCRQISATADGQLSNESVGGWGEDLLSGGMGTISAISGELTEEDRRLASALMAVQFVQQGRQPLIHDIGNITKVVSDRHDVETSTGLVDHPLRIYQPSDSNGSSSHIMRASEDLSDVDVRSLAGLPPMPPLKRIADNMWFHSKAAMYKQNFKLQEAEEVMMNVVGGSDADLDVAASSPAQNRQQNKKSLPHKKRISRKLKKNASNGSHSISNREILHGGGILADGGDNVISGNRDQVNDDHSHIQSVVRPVFICQVCGDFYGEDQLKFYSHLKHHYEPHSGSIIMENSMSNMQHQSNNIELDKIETSLNHGRCEVVDNAGPLPDSLVELSLENSVASKLSMYQHQHEKVSLYANSGDKSLYSIPSNKNLACHPDALQDKSSVYHHTTMEHNGNAVYDDKLHLYNCPHCGKLFKRQKTYEMHVKEVHLKPHHTADMNEFSEPEDLMEGIEVVVDPENDDYIQEEINNQNSGSVSTIHHIMADDEHILPHLTIENGHVHQEHLNLKQWYVKNLEDVNANALPGGDQTPSGTADHERDSDEHEFACPLCGEILSGREAYSQHAQHCHIHLKEDVLQRMMEVEVEVSSGGTVGDELASDINENSNQTIPELDTAKDLDLTVSKKENDTLDNANLECDDVFVEGIKKKMKKNSKMCIECGRTFNHRNSLIYHMLSHSGTRPYQCKDCGKGFFAKSALKVHTRLHSGVKPYKCGDCGRTFRQWGDLRYHTISLHSNQKLHKCEYCNKEFARKYSLIIHRRIHTGEKNYLCEFCNKTFRASSYLQNHRRIHTGEKPYLCGTCGKAFRVRGDMRRHQMTHAKFDLSEEEKKKKENHAKLAYKLASTIKEELVVADRSRDRESNSIQSSEGDFLEITKHDLDNDDQDRSVTVKTQMETPHHVPHHLVSGDPLDPNGPLYQWPIFMT